MALSDVSICFWANFGDKMAYTRCTRLNTTDVIYNKCTHFYIMPTFASLVVVIVFMVALIRLYLIKRNEDVSEYEPRKSTTKNSSSGTKKTNPC